MISPGVYRSGYPNKRNYPFLQKLGLKCIIYLSTDEYSQENLDFISENNIKFIQYPISGNKEPFGEIDHQVMAQALNQVLDSSNYPMLVHCNKGKHRVGCLVGCLRKVQDWSLTSIFDEYKRFTDNKGRIVDQEFIEIFSADVNTDRRNH